MSKPTPAPLPKEDGLYWVKRAEKHIGGYQKNWDKAKVGPWMLVEYHLEEWGANLEFVGSDEEGEWGNPNDMFCDYVVVEVGPKVSPPDD